MANIKPVVTIPMKFVTQVVWSGDSTDTMLAFVLNGITPLSMTIQCNGGTMDVFGSMRSNSTFPAVLKDTLGVDLLNVSDGVISSIAQRPATIIPTMLTGTGAEIILTIWR